MKHDIEQNGGFLHENLRFCAGRRVLKLSKETKAIETNQPVLIMRIPRESMITRQLAIHLISPWWPCVVTFLEESREQLFSSSDDILLALALAYVAESEPLDTREDSLAKAYLSTLPKESSYWDSLPRRWSERDLKRRLQGSPVLAYARKAKFGIDRDFQLLKDGFRNIKGEDRHEFPVLFDRFSDMLAAVSSRAFSIEAESGTEQSVALVPILDLCDHCRGRNVQELKREKKNLSYTYSGGTMRVNAFSDESSNAPVILNANETLKITYGAQGNAQLLMNYGFALKYNLEPDGSSNDVLETTLGTSVEGKTTVVNLRTGGKDYSYGCLIKALAYFNAGQENATQGSDLEDEEDDMEAFLNGDDEGGEEIDMYGEDTDFDCNEALASGNSGVVDDIKSLSYFSEALTRQLALYPPKEDSELIASTSSQQADYFADLLVQSEQRTLHFYLLAARKIIALLQGSDVLMACQKFFPETQDQSLVEGHTTDLAKAFLAIRHSDSFP